jgi:DNA topoisomerase-1
LLIDDERIVRIIRSCQELPGQHLFQYLAGEGRRCPVDSGQVNDYLREAMGDDFTAKDFRTWGATLHALMLLGRTPRELFGSESALKRAITEVVKKVAAELRNTPAVCRKSYINPRVFDKWRAGALGKAIGESRRRLSTRKAEALVLDLLR